MQAIRISNNSRTGWKFGKIGYPETYNEKKCCELSGAFDLNGSSLFLQLRKTTVKAWMSLNFLKIPLPLIELALLEHLFKKFMDNVRPL